VSLLYDGKRRQLKYRWLAVTAYTGNRAVYGGESTTSRASVQSAGSASPPAGSADRVSEFNRHGELPHLMLRYRKALIKWRENGAQPPS
jgi:hypothetical protein